MLNIPLHYWVSKKGYILSSSHIKPTKENKKIGKVRYIGYTFDEGWPKKMNTGRLFYPSRERKKSYGVKHPHYKKEADLMPHKTDNTIKQQGHLSPVPNRKYGVVTDNKKA